MSSQQQKHNKNTRKGQSRGAAVAGRRIVVEFSEELLKAAEETASQLATDRSKLIRSAVECYVRMTRQKRLEQELAAGYAANADVDRMLCREFAFIDAES